MERLEYEVSCELEPSVYQPVPPLWSSRAEHQRHFACLEGHWGGPFSSSQETIPLKTVICFFSSFLNLQ